MDVIKEYSSQVILKRLSENSSEFELALAVRLKNYEALTQLKNKINEISPEISLNFIDNSSLLTSY